ncbi:MAG: aminoacyl-tRNA hydrolase [Gammaproteobacteria bacterium]|nr:MAG: aminoacyl-tRNA hydrolase [Gammaproteobacteria bacterium]
MSEAIRLIVGLGNPGPEYAGTRHNAGADLVEALAAAEGERLREEKRFRGLTGRITLGGADVRLLIPTTFMNRSGEAVVPLLAFYRLQPAAMLVAHDELDLPPGAVRLKRGGGHGGNNGLRDIIRALGGDQDFGRLRLGVGHPGDKSRVTGHLLSRAADADRKLIAAAMDEALPILPLLAAGDWERAMTELHTRNRAGAAVADKDN